MVHGGAGRGSADRAEAVAAEMARAVRCGWDGLRAGGRAVDAVMAAVALLEDSPLFNAGRGSVLTAAGAVEMDASLMDGRDLSAGAVCAVTGVRHPIQVARAVRDRSAAVLLAAEEARAWAEECGLDLCPPEALVTGEQRRRWREQAGWPHGDTVGAVAVDAAGDVAAATSTGGVFFKRPGRVGDSAVIGAGTYADNCSGAASATGQGEAIIRMGLAKLVTERMAAGAAPQRAVDRAIRLLSERTGAAAGVIAVDPFGRIGHAANTPYMPVAWMRPGMPDVGIVAA